MMKKQAFYIALAGGSMLMLGGCEPIYPESYGAAVTIDSVTLGNPTSGQVDEGGASLYSPLEATVTFKAKGTNFTFTRPAAATYDGADAEGQPVFGVDDVTKYDPGCEDTSWSSEFVTGMGWFAPVWSPMDCPGPDIDENITWADWDTHGHVHVFLDGIFVGEGYPTEDGATEIEATISVLKQPLYYLRTDYDRRYERSNRGERFANVVLDRNGVIEPFIQYNPFNGSFIRLKDKNNDRQVDRGQDWNQNGVIEANTPEDKDGDGYMDRPEDIDGDGKLDNVFYDYYQTGITKNGLYPNPVTNYSYWMRGEDLDGDAYLDTNEDRAPTGNQDGFNGLVFSYFGYYDLGTGQPGEDVDCDGKLDKLEDLNANGALDDCEDVDEDGVLDGIDTDWDLVPDSDEDLDGDGEIDVMDEDLDGDCWVDGWDPVYVAEQYTETEDIDKDGRLDTFEDWDFDGVLYTGESEDLNGNGMLDVDETKIVSPTDGDGNPYFDYSKCPFGCEGDEAFLVDSSFLLFDWYSYYISNISHTYYNPATPVVERIWGVSGATNKAFCEENENTTHFLSFQLVHDDHSEIYGSPRVRWELKSEEMKLLFPGE